MYLLFEFVLNYLKIGLRNSLSQISSFLNLIGSQNIYTGVSSDYMVFFISIKLFGRVKRSFHFCLSFSNWTAKTLREWPLEDEVNMSIFKEDSCIIFDLWKQSRFFFNILCHMIFSNSETSHFLMPDYPNIADIRLFLNFSSFPPLFFP